jgi:hypothetical protein
MNKVGVVIAELQLALALSAEKPKNPAIKSTLASAQKHLAEAIKSLGGQDLHPDET